MSTFNENYQRIAEIIVDVKRMMDDEKRSAKNDLLMHTKGMASMKNVSAVDGADTSVEYGAYLTRSGAADKNQADYENEFGRAVNDAQFVNTLSELDSLKTMYKTDLLDSEYEYEADYDKARDEKEDYFYDLKADLIEKYEKKKKKTSSSSGRTSSKKNDEEYEQFKEPTRENILYAMPKFAPLVEGVTQNFTNDIYAKAFRQKAIYISDNATEVADINELNALLKMAKQYGASEEYLDWLCDVCGY
ncbi:MAG: hypothetical protein IKM61_09925 [Eubacteriaceae bacterium]|nr:hypothetical protein [Eubacteriaceae bacterium]